MVKRKVEYLPINMCVADDQWRYYMHRSTDKRFEVFRQRVLKRDEYRCCYCGYSSRLGLNIINRDGNYRNNKVVNMASACGFCSQCFFLDAIGQASFGGGVLVHLPHMSQNDLNAAVHVLFASIIAGLSSSGMAKSHYRSLRLLSQVIESQLGSGLSDPALYGRMVIDMGQKKTQAFHQSFCSEVRLLPDLNAFAASVQDDLLDSLQILKQAY